MNHETLVDVKKGETMLHMSVGRSSAGLVIKAKAHPLIEEFFRSRSTGDAGAINLHGRHWHGLKGYPDLEIYPQPSAPGRSELFVQIPSTGRHMSVYYPGQPIELKSDITGMSGAHVLNMGWLTLKGISEGAGIAFAIRGVYTKEKIDELAKLMEAATRLFYIQFLRPVNVQIQMIVTETTML